MSPEESYNDEDPSTTKTIPKPEPLLLEPENLEDRVVVVTGGGWNIGRAIALRCAHQRATVIICSRNEKNLLATVEAAAEADLNVRHVVLDIKDPDSVASEFEEIIATESRIDVLACMAGGFGAGKPLHETDPGEWLDVVLRNLYGTFLCCRAVLPGMIERRQGDILTCAGGGAFFPVIGLNATAYACAKAAICRFTDQLYSEVMDTPGIQINCMEPGMTLNPVDLERIRREETETGRPHPLREMNHSPQDAADLAMFLLSPYARGLNGRLLSTDEDWWRSPDKVKRVIPTDFYRLRRNFVPE